MKILFAIKSLDDAKGGAERVLTDITAGLIENKHNICILSYDTTGGKPFYPLHKKARRICLNIGNPKEKSTLSESILRMKALRKTVREEKPDIVIAFMHSMFVPMAFSLIGTGIPIVASEHIVPTHYKSRWMEFFLIILSGFLVKKITVLSNTVKNTYPKVLQRKMVSIANPVTLPKGFSDPSGRKEGRNIILSVGRLDPQKDHKTLISAFSALAKEYSTWDLYIFGEGNLLEELQNQVDSYGLQDRVFLPGATRDISAEYQKAQIFALPSRYESFGLATAEAMAHGLPVVGFADCPGTNELIQHQKNGILISGSNRVQSLQIALEGLIQGGALRNLYGKNAKEILNKYNSESILSCWESLIDECVICSKTKPVL